ncbi:hypothetical protein ACWCQZ_46385 [Streptomyces sp. NPDC002285]
MAALPPLSPEQCRAALCKAAAAHGACRGERGPQARQALDARGAGQCLRGHPQDAGPCPARIVPGIGKVRAQKLTEMEISDSRRLSGLHIQQRERLLDRFAPQSCPWLPHHARRPRLPRSCWAIFRADARNSSAVLHAIPVQ